MNVLRIVTGLLVLVSLAWGAPVWKSFHCPQGGFVGVLPAAPKPSQSETDTPLGKVTTQIFTSSNQAGTYSIAFTDLPGAAVKFASDKVINDARAGLLKDANARETNWANLADGGHELIYQSARADGWCHFHLIGSRLYVLDARMKSRTDRALWVNPFFAKFHAQE